MMVRNRVPKPRSEYAVLPSNQMIIRRYRSLEGKRDLSTYFEQGLFCKQLSVFDDKNEGLVEDAATRGGLRGGSAVVAGSKRRRTDDDDIEKATDAEFLAGLKKYHQHIREQHFANCWRLGTDESDEIWKEYTRDPNRVQGCAVETTVGQFLSALPRFSVQQESQQPPKDLSETPIWNVALNNNNCDIRVGACRYQQRDQDGVLQPGGSPAVVFFKGADFAIENELRVVFNPFQSNILLDADARGIPQVRAPSVNKNFRKLPTATKWMTNRIVLAPNSGAREREKLERWLDQFGITIGSVGDTDVHIVESATCVNRTETHEYLAEVGGTANFEESADHLEDVIQEFIDLRDADKWPVLDIVLLMQEKGGSIVEGYWHRNESDAFRLDEYGHDFQNVWVIRLGVDGDTAKQWRNKNAQAFDTDQGSLTLDIT